MSASKNAVPASAAKISNTTGYRLRPQFAHLLQAFAAILIVGLFTAVALFTYRPDDGEILDEAVNDQRISISGELLTPTPTLLDTGSIDDDVPAFSDEGEQAPDAATESSRDKSSQTQLLISEQGRWLATDYSEGDINPGSYTVARGDTLWEIAEAVYGNGSMWTTILEANHDNIGFLANGSQALIVPGQVLTIPLQL